jgi:hypothetical protein
MKLPTAAKTGSGEDIPAWWASWRPALHDRPVLLYERPLDRMTAPILRDRYRVIGLSTFDRPILRMIARPCYMTADRYRANGRSRYIIADQVHDRRSRFFELVLNFWDVS